MKPNELRQMLRQMIKEEVAAEVSKAMGKVLVEMVKEIKKSPAAPVLEDAEDTSSAPVLKTNNPRLNSVLEETARNFKPLPRSEENSLVSLMEGGFEKIGKHATPTPDQPKTKMDFLKQMVTESVRETPSALDGGAAVPDVLKNVFKKDFRAILQKSKEKGGGGYFNPSAVLSGDSEPATP